MCASGIQTSVCTGQRQDALWAQIHDPQSQNHGMLVRGMLAEPVQERAPGLRISPAELGDQLLRSPMLGSDSILCLKFYLCSSVSQC